MANELSNYEDRLKVLVNKNALKMRQTKCESCKHMGSNNFCQINFMFLPEFLPYKYNACPKKLWVET